MLRDAGVEFYDDWVTHAVPFDDPAVVSAMEKLDALLGGEGYLQYGRLGVSQTPWVIAFRQMFPDEGNGCWMLSSGSFIDPDFVDDVDFFVLPPGPSAEHPSQLGGANFAVAMTDRPEVRELMKYFAGTEFGKVTALGAGYLSPRLDFDPSHFGGPDDAYANLKRKAYALQRSAMIAGEWRFDGSDLMPGAIGLLTPEGDQGSFYRTMIDLADGVLSPSGAAAQVEADWRRFDETASIDP